jgi:maltodextrin utilization protein YvdJ
MRASRHVITSFLHFCLILFFSLALSGCIVKLVADYDSVTFEEVLKVGKRVDKFYGDLLETQVNDRKYQKFSSQYVEIETDVRSLVTRNQARALNEESTQIAEITLKLWVKYKDAHKEKDAYSDGTAKLDRNRFVRLFAAAASAEQAKKLDVDDKDTTKDSK